ncbi:hypothetical protein EDC01DRAFT_683443 [Geopyxis carbonaria]|nr:hypothetical protein EDC01DRAFT_683443 [Geopyxis carbonaria]
MSSQLQRVVAAGVVVMVLLQVWSVAWQTPVATRWAAAPVAAAGAAGAAAEAVTVTVTAEATTTVTQTPTRLPLATPLSASLPVTAPAPAGAPLDPHAYPHLPPGAVSNTSNIALLIKTGATEALRRIPIHALTTLTHVPTYSIFSDLEQQIGALTLHDSLRDIDPTLIATLADFEFYTAQQRLRDPETAPNQSGAWKLDKYKNLHVASRALALHPHADWFVFIDADTYVLWSNLATWLSQLNASTPLFLGSIALYRFDGQDDLFAHGGSGYIVSRGGMAATLGAHPGMPRQYESAANRSCCGDHVFALALKDAGLNVSDARPAINGDPPHALRFERRMLCAPLVTMHHVSPRSMLDVWAWEQRETRPGRVLRWADAYDEFVKEEFEKILAEGGQRSGWDNMATNGAILPLHNETAQAELDGQDQKAHRSAKRCRGACERRKDCFQYKWRSEKGGKCWLGDIVWRLGDAAVEPDLERKKYEWTSGWLVERIMEAVKEKVPCVGEAAFPWVGGEKGPF